MTKTKVTERRARKKAGNGAKKKAAMVTAKVKKHASRSASGTKPKTDGRKTLVRHGNSLALVIDRQILNQLALDESTPLRVSVAGSGIRVERADVGLGTERTRDILKELREDKKFVQMMRDLAK